MNTQISTLFGSLILIVLGAWFLTSCKGNFVIDAKHGNGSMATETRQLPPFKRVVVEGSLDLKVDGARDLTQSVQINADQNLLPLFKTEVRDSTLHIYSESGYSSKLKLNAVLHVPGFSGVAVQGSSDVDVRNVQCYSFEVQIDGSGDVKAEGVAQRSYIAINGSGDVSTEALKTESTEVHVNGSGDVAVQATKLLDVHVNGSGDVVYSGNPESIKKDINGSGSVKRKP